MGADSGGGGDASWVFRFDSSILFNALLFLIQKQRGNQRRRLGGGKRRGRIRIGRWSWRYDARMCKCKSLLLLILLHYLLFLILIISFVNSVEGGSGGGGSGGGDDADWGGWWTQNVWGGRGAVDGEAGNSGAGLLNDVFFHYITLTLIIKNNMGENCIYLYFLLLLVSK